MNPVMLLAVDMKAGPTLLERIAACGAWCLTAEGRIWIAAVLSVLGIWLMLPKGRCDRRSWGAFLAVIGGGMLVSTLPSLGLIWLTGVFWVLAGVAIASGVATITSRNPVYAAIWFAVTLLATGGLLLVNGAQFLGIATVAVYAGAIVVTLLFVLMLAQPAGHAFFDRISWGLLPTLLATAAGVGLIVSFVFTVQGIAPDAFQPIVAADNPVLVDQHVAALGGRLFSRHLISVQAAGLLLFAALVGAVAIASRDAQPRDPLQRMSKAAVSGDASSREALG